MSTSNTTTPKKKLEGKVAVVTGGASGIGEATTRRFVEHGVRAIVIADILDEKGHNLVASIGPERCTYIHCDVVDEDQVKALVDTTVRLYGRIDIMFSNAGILSRRDQTILGLDFSDYDKVLAVNVRGMALCVKYAALAMVEGKVRGSIVCTASILADIGTYRATDYTMSKHAVLGLVRSASLQLSEKGIRVNCISPGAVDTSMLHDMLKMEKDEAIDHNRMESFSLLNVGALTVKNVADAVVFLVSEEGEFVTGHNLVVSGGSNTAW